MRACILQAVLVVTFVAVVVAELQLSLQGCRVQPTYTGSRKLRWVKFFMSIDQTVTFRKAQYKIKLKCRGVDTGKACSRVGGPCLLPGQDVYYALKVKFAGRKVLKIRPDKPWTSPITTTTAASSTTIITTSVPSHGMTVLCGKICELDVASLRCAAVPGAQCASAAGW